MYLTNEHERMMEKFVLQLDSLDLVRVDNFVRAICDENHIDNYYATISVSVTKAVESAFASGSENQKCNHVALSFGYSPKGITFKVTSKQGLLNPSDLSIISMLADEVELLDDDSSLQMTFAIRGIDHKEAAQRVATLEHFYHPAPAEVLQM